MFDDDELEQIREDQGDWQGHIDRQTVKKSKTSKKILAGSVGASFVATSFMVFLVFSGMMGSAFVGLAGLGGFSADIEKLVGSDVAIYPALGPTAGCPSTSTNGDFIEGGGQGDGTALENNGDAPDAVTVPQLRADIGDAEIPKGSNLTLNKDIQVPEILNLKMIRVSIGQDSSIQGSNTGTVGNVSLGNSSLYVTGLKAGQLTAFDTEIRESYTDGTAANPKFGSTGEFVLEGSGGGSNNQVTLANATARAHFLSFETLTLPNLDLAIEYFNQSGVDDLANNPDRIDPVIGDNASTFSDCPAVDGQGTDNPF